MFHFTSIHPSQISLPSSVELLSSELALSQLSIVELLSSEVTLSEFTSNELLSAVALDWEITSCISEEERGVLFVTLSAKLSETELLSVEDSLAVGL